MEQKKENIIDYARRMRKLCGFELDENYNQFSNNADAHQEDNEIGFVVHEIKQTPIEKSPEDTELYKLK